ncbi:MAG TPA: glycosyltransferase family A protein [Mycobacteriales bacterium]|jgi:glycosyltransferase involved in cell wall biosynthesis|nr:glycosyltransferase family A protein [Mycobacteriales bacterium]
MQTATPIETAQSAAWQGAAPAVAVVVSSHSRGTLLDGLLDVLESQDHNDFEVIVADNGSADDTWSVLTSRCARTPLRLRALRLPFHDGPAVPRNTCIVEARAGLVAFTDDDCLPTPAWLSSITGAFDDETVVVQGRTVPEPGGWAGPWGRSLNVTSASGLYETANLAARRAAIDTAGGFGGKRLLSGRAFGEDVVLGAAIARIGGFRFAPDALVHHRVMPGTYADFVRERRRLSGFPQLLRLVPELRERAYLKVFLGRRRAVTDLGLAGIVATIVMLALGHPLGAITLIAMLPWLRRLWRESAAYPGLPRALRSAQLMYADVIGFGALVAGSVRARRLLL